MALYFIFSANSSSEKSAETKCEILRDPKDPKENKKLRTVGFTFDNTTSYLLRPENQFLQIQVFLQYWYSLKVTKGFSLEIGCPCIS
jgi:hypothetical protein